MKPNTPIRFHYYLAAILIPLLLAAPAGIIVLDKIGTGIDLIRQEITGLHQVQQLKRIVSDLQNLRGIGQILARGHNATLHDKMIELEQQLDLKLANFRFAFPEDPFSVLDDLARTIDKRKNRFATALPATLPSSPMHRFEEDTVSIHDLQNIIQQISVHSGLIPDDDPTTHFLAELLINGLSDLEESIGQARGLGSGFLASQTHTQEDRFRFWEHLGGIRRSMESVERNRWLIEQSLEPSPAPFTCLSGPIQNMVKEFLILGQSIVVPREMPTDPNLFFSEATSTISIINNCSDTIQEDLLQTLGQRQQAETDLYHMFLLGSGLSITLVVFFVTSFYRNSRTAFIGLYNSLNQNQSILNSAVDGIITIDHHGIIHSINASLEKMFGYTSEELIGQNVSMLMPSPYRESHDQYIHSFLTTGIKKIIGTIREVSCICKDGREFPAQLSVGVFDSKDGKYFTGILHDITERKQTKDALQAAYGELEQRIQERTRELEASNVRLKQEIDERNRAEEGLKLAAKVFENASEAIVITDQKGTIIDVNQAYTAITGFSRDEVLGRNPRIGKSGKHDAQFYTQMWADITQRGTWSGEIWDRRKNGESYPKWLTINAVPSHDGTVAHFVGIFTDISHMKATEERLEQLAFFDPLTALPNRMLFRDRLVHEFETAKRCNTLVAVFFIDLDRFKHVNDTLGHAAGDQLLIEVARRITQCVRASDTVARLGGDEFTVILAGLKSSREAEPIARKIITALMEPVTLQEHKAHIGASVGISIYPTDGDTFDAITKYADVAMYHAKESGRGNFKFFEERMNAHSIQRAAMEHNLRQGLIADEFILHYQPKRSIATRKIVGMESLVRWRRGDGTMVSPADFIPMAEETGLIIPMGKKILHMACHFNQTRIQAGGVPLRVAVNLSARQFQQKDLLELVQRTLDESGLDPQWLELEVTESMMMQDEKQAIATLKQLRNLGISISMDDFGTGYSSLSYLKRLPIQALKIDQSFVRELTENSDDAAIVLAIVSMAKSLKLHVVAEGVETQQQAEFLEKIECDELQGYHFSRPLPEQAFVEFVNACQTRNYAMDP
ncbi:MAG: EAL domain-containing protein [Magnetococcales bacterium]|nr:EAL domain-containing protein [Magnetococcales bacterium]